MNFCAQNAVQVNAENAVKLLNLDGGKLVQSMGELI